MRVIKLEIHFLYITKKMSKTVKSQENKKFYFYYNIFLLLYLQYKVNPPHLPFPASNSKKE